MRRWDQKAVDELKAQREELQLGMKELPDLREVRAQEVAVTADITGLEQRMKFKVPPPRPPIPQKCL